MMMLAAVYQKVMMLHLLAAHAIAWFDRRGDRVGGPIPLRRCGGALIFRVPRERGRSTTGFYSFIDSINYEFDFIRSSMQSSPVHRHARAGGEGMDFPPF